MFGRRRQAWAKLIFAKWKNSGRVTQLYWFPGDHISLSRAGRELTMTDGPTEVTTLDLIRKLPPGPTWKANEKIDIGVCRCFFFLALITDDTAPMASWHMRSPYTGILSINLTVPVHNIHYAFSWWSLPVWIHAVPDPQLRWISNMTTYSQRQNFNKKNGDTNGNTAEV